MTTNVSLALGGVISPFDARTFESCTGVADEIDAARFLEQGRKPSSRSPTFARFGFSSLGIRSHPSRRKNPLLFRDLGTFS